MMPERRSALAGGGLPLEFGEQIPAAAQGAGLQADQYLADPPSNVPSGPAWGGGAWEQANRNFLNPPRSGIFGMEPPRRITVLDRKRRPVGRASLGGRRSSVGRHLPRSSICSLFHMDEEKDGKNRDRGPPAAANDKKAPHEVFANMDQELFEKAERWRRAKEYFFRAAPLAPGGELLSYQLEQPYSLLAASQSTPALNNDEPPPVWQHSNNGFGGPSFFAQSSPNFGMMAPAAPPPPPNAQQPFSLTRELMRQQALQQPKFFGAGVLWSNPPDPVTLKDERMGPALGGSGLPVGRDRDGRPVWDDEDKNRMMRATWASARRPSGSGSSAGSSSNSHSSGSAGPDQDAFGGGERGARGGWRRTLATPPQRRQLLCVNATTTGPFADTVGEDVVFRPSQAGRFRPPSPGATSLPPHINCRGL